jgi:serine protease Do
MNVLKRCALLLLMALLALPWPARAGLVEIVEATKPSVLAVGTANALKSPRFSFRGTGFVVGDGNHLITNFHVLPPTADADPADRLAVVLPKPRDDRDVRAATLVASDPAHDLALLKFEGPPLPTLALADPGAVVKDGSSVVLIGYPIGVVLGFVPVTHRGIVAASVAVAQPQPSARQLTERAVARMRQGSFEVYQLDATAYPGNSGSPVLDVESGRVLGVLNSVFVKASRESALSQPTGISYAIPIRHAAELLANRR